MCVAHVFSKEALCTCRVPAPGWMAGRLRGEVTGWGGGGCVSRCDTAPGRRVTCGRLRGPREQDGVAHVKQ